MNRIANATKAVWNMMENARRGVMIYVQDDDIRFVTMVLCELGFMECAFWENENLGCFQLCENQNDILTLNLQIEELNLHLEELRDVIVKQVETNGAQYHHVDPTVIATHTPMANTNQSQTFLVVSACVGSEMIIEPLHKHNSQPGEIHHRIRFIGLETLNALVVY